MILQGLTKRPFKPPEDATIKDWSLKVILWVAVTSARRVRELQAFSIIEAFLTIFLDWVVLRASPGFLSILPIFVHLVLKK